MFIVFDLDGTLSDPSHRLYLIQNEPKDWDEFYRQCINDEPIVPMITLLQRFNQIGEFVEIRTGRSDIAYNETKEWFYKYAKFMPRIRMREHGDHTPDDQLKLRWLREWDWKPNIVFEDRPRVVQMYRQHGVMCCQVNDFVELDNIGKLLDNNGH